MNVKASPANKEAHIRVASAHYASLSGLSVSLLRVCRYFATMGDFANGAMSAHPTKPPEPPPPQSQPGPVTEISSMARNLGWKMVVDSEQGRILGAAAGGGGGGW